MNVNVTAKDDATDRLRAVAEVAANGHAAWRPVAVVWVVAWKLVWLLLAVACVVKAFRWAWR